MVNFLLLNYNISNYTKSDIDKGLTPPEIYKLCSCIRETFCLSYSIRKKANLYLFFLKTTSLIKFQGDQLKFLGSDERSQALLLNKAINRLYENKCGDEWIKSTPGIFVRKFYNLQQLLYFFKNVFQNRIFFISDHAQGDFILEYKELRFIKELNGYLFILSNINNPEKEIEIINSLKMFHNLKCLNIPNIKKLEDKILFINYFIENQKCT